MERAEARAAHNSVWHAEPQPQRAKCVVCRIWFDFDELNDEGMCGVCEKNIEGFEEGRIA